MALKYLRFGPIAAEKDKDKILKMLERARQELAAIVTLLEEINVSLKKIE